MKSRKAFLIMALTLLMGASSTCFSQSTEKINKLEEFLGIHVTELSRVHMNLLQMNSAVPQVEPALDNTTDYVSSAHQEVDKVMVLLQVYTVMVDETDRYRVRMFLQVQAKGTIKMLDYSIEGINRYLVRFQSKAVISEVQKARDLVLKIKAEIERVVPVK
jgi:hypothetical protein